jgi:glycine C-acetyltransferase
LYVKTIEKSLELVQDPEPRQRMWHIAKLLQEGLTDLGYDIGETESPITPVYVPTGDEKFAMGMISLLREEFGVFVSGVMFPVVPPGVVLFRMIPTAAHSEDDVEKTVEAFRKMRDALKLDLSQRPSLVNR